MRIRAIRVISGYRTVSLDASLLLARIAPIYLIASLRKRVYERIKDLRSGVEWSMSAEKDIRLDEKLTLRRQWEIHFSRPNLSGIRTRAAILLHFHQWLNRCHDSMSYRVTQILTGHGCFSTYLYRIGKMDSPRCEYCDDVNAEDSAEHTLQDCAAWTREREALNSFKY